MNKQDLAYINYKGLYAIKQNQTKSKKKHREV